MIITADTCAEANVLAYQHILYRGESVSPRGMETREVLGLQLRVTHPESISTMEIGGRDLKLAIGWIEMCMFIGQTSLPESLTDRWKIFHDYTDGGILTGSYGIRTHGAIDLVLRELKRDPDSRKAVLTINQTHRDLASPTRDTPCTLSLQFLNRRGKLHCHVAMRSNDMWLGLAYDMAMFIGLQATLAQELGVSVGEYVHTAASAHLYSKHYEVARECEAIENEVVPMYWSTASVEDTARWCRRTLVDLDSRPIGTPFENLVRREIAGRPPVPGGAR